MDLEFRCPKCNESATPVLHVFACDDYSTKFVLEASPREPSIGCGACGAWWRIELKEMVFMDAVQPPAPSK